MRLGLGIAIVAAMALASCGPKVAGPEAVVADLYEPYEDAGGAVPPFDSRDIFTPELKSEISKAVTYGNLLNEPVIDYDPIAGAQEWEIKDVVTAPVGAMTGDTATVSAKFTNLGAAKELRYAMTRIDGVWRVDDIFEGEVGLRSIIADALKPAGDPAAMEAPVRAVYAKYATDTDVESLHLWAPLTPDLQRMMTMAAAMGRSGQAALLDFDPVLDDDSHDLGPVQYESASSGVIARFDNAREPKIVVYDVTEQNGAWKIANIRSPGNWDLLQKLSEAGIK